MSDSRSLGNSLGRSVGKPDGRLDGRLVGSRDGNVGSLVGNLVGSAVGMLNDGSGVRLELRLLPGVFFPGVSSPPDTMSATATTAPTTTIAVIRMNRGLGRLPGPRCPPRPSDGSGGSGGSQSPPPCVGGQPPPGGGP